MCADHDHDHDHDHDCDHDHGSSIFYNSHEFPRNILILSIKSIIEFSCLESDVDLYV